MRKSGENSKHAYPQEALRDLPRAIAEPIAVFKSTLGERRVILTELRHEGRNFIVVAELQNRSGKGGLVHQVNRIQNLYPKDSRGIVKWVLDNQLLYADKAKAPQWLEGLLSSPAEESFAQSKPESAEVLDATKVVESFENPPVPAAVNPAVEGLAASIA
jgi:hypothetical protein